MTGGTDQAYVSGDTVEMTPTSRYAKDLYDWGITHANADGTLKTSAVQQALNISQTSTDWTPLANVPTLSASNGQREHQLTWTGVDYTNRLQPGTKLQIPRTSTVPTQSASFVAASLQSASKTSPVGITFTGDWSAEAWVSLNSYTNTNQGIISRDASSSSGSGFEFNITQNGQLSAFFRNATGASSAITYQSLPLSKKVHVAVTVTVANGNAGFQFYIDGVVAPAQAGTGTAATSVVQATTPLTLGNRAGSAVGYLDGILAHVRLWAVARTAQNIRDNMNKSMVGNETGLVGAWSLNGDWTDKTSNANTLTASGGAIATYADNPWKATEYAIVTGISYTSGNTVATVFTGPNTLPNETLGTTSYSSVRAPFGFPADKGKWKVATIINSSITASSPAVQWYNLGGTCLVTPTGSWRIYIQGDYSTSSGSPVALGQSIQLSASSSTPDSPLDLIFNYENSSVSVHSPVYRELSRITSSSTPLYLLQKPYATGYSTMAIDAGLSPCIIAAECAYL